MNKLLKIGAVLAISQWLFCGAANANTDIRLQGVNLSGAEFGGCTKTVRYGYDYAYPKNDVFDTFIALGMNAFRLPFCWERLQPTAMQDLDAAELGRLDAAVNYATSHGAYLILDPHNYASYQNGLIGAATTNAMLADFWRRVAAHYRDNNRVVFGLMNEPHGITSETWLSAANEAIGAIRAAGAKNLILVPGTAWTGAHSWASLSYGTPNAVTMLNVNDPANNYAYDVHQYFDKDSSGTKPECVSAAIGAERISNITTWAKTNKKQLFLGEFGGSRTDLCYQAVRNTLASIQQNPDVWIGWTYWSTGAMIQKYMFALPLKPQPGETSQLDVLKEFLTKNTPCSGDNCRAPNPPVMNPMSQ